jgi:peroxin-6
MFSKSIGAPKIQVVKWDDVGGLANVKEEIMSALRPSVLHMKRSGNKLKLFYFSIENILSTLQNN